MIKPFIALEYFNQHNKNSAKCSRDDGATFEASQNGFSWPIIGFRRHKIIIGVLYYNLTVKNIRNDVDQLIKTNSQFSPWRTNSSARYQHQYSPSAMTSSSIPKVVIDADVDACEQDQDQLLSSLSGSNTIYYPMHHDTKMYDDCPEEFRSTPNYLEHLLDSYPDTKSVQSANLSRRKLWQSQLIRNWNWIKSLMNRRLVYLFPIHAWLNNYQKIVVCQFLGKSVNVLESTIKCLARKIRLSDAMCEAALLVCSRAFKAFLVEMKV